MIRKKLLSKQIEDLVDNISFFRGTPKDLLMNTISYVGVLEYPSSQSILFDNHCDGSIYFIADGWIKVRISDSQSNNNIYRLYGPEEMIGAIAAVEENWYPKESLTLTPAKVWSIRTKDFVDLLKCHPQSSIKLAIFASKRLRKMNRYFQIQQAESLVKVVYILLELIGDTVEWQKRRVLIPNLPHREIAALSGISRETVTRSLGRLEKRGLILRQGANIKILELESLRQIVKANGH